MKLLRRLVNRTLLVAFVVAGTAVAAQAQTVVVQGNRRVDSETVRSYFTGDVAQGEKDLRATGLFSSVRARREGGRVVVTVAENNSINRVVFEGNSKLKSETLLAEIQSKNRGPYSPELVDADAAKVREIYKRQGRGLASVTARTVDLPNGRVDVVFTVVEGDKTGVKSIVFQGNRAYSEGKLRGLITTTEMNLLSFIKTSDVYDPDRIASDLELVRRYYLKNGYADFRIVSSDARFDAGQGGWIVTVTLDEGLPYTVGAVVVDSRLPSVGGDTLRDLVRLSPGDTYNGDVVEKATEQLTRSVGRRGYPFAQVRPRGRPRRRQPRRQPRLRGRGRAARLHRAHQRARQHPVARLCGAARVRPRRGRRVQPCADRPRRAPAQQSRLLQEGARHQRAGLRARSRDRKRRRRGSADRRVLHRGRLFVVRRLDLRSVDHRIELPRPRPIRAPRRAARREVARRRFLVHRAPTFSTPGSRRASTSSPNRPTTPNMPSIRTS